LLAVKPSKIFYGWWLVILTGIVSGVGTMIIGQGASVLFKPIASDLGIDRSTASVANGVSGLVQGACFALAGWLTTKYGPRWVIFGGTCLAGIGLIMMNFISSPLSYYLIWGIVVAIGITLGLSIPIETMLTNWFIRKRGLAYSLKWGLSGGITIALLPVLSWLTQQHGWKIATTIWGICLILSSGILLYFVKQKRPEYYGLNPDGALPIASLNNNKVSLINDSNKYAAAIQETEFTFKQAVRTSSYWMVVAGWSIITIIVSGLSLHIVPFLTDRGIDPVVAASMLAIAIFFILPARILGSLMSDYVKKNWQKYTLSTSMLLITLGLIILLLMPNALGIYFLLALYGLGFGAYVPLNNLMLARFFGRKDFGSILGVIQLITAPLAFLSPLYTGWIYDTRGSYLPAFTLFAILGFVGTIMVCFIQLPRLPEQVADQYVSSKQ
jgi:MFS family permease